jgi:hypothetical protein
VHSIGASTPKDQTPLATLTRDCREYYDYVEKIYAIALLDHKTGRLFPEAREVLMERYKLATREAVDNLSTTVPVVGMKIDKNNFFVYGNVIMIIILYILLLSIRSEMRCLQDISPLALGNAARAKAIINSHMFSGQRQGRMAFAWIFLFFPSAMSLTRLYTDAETFAIPWKLLGPFWAILLLVLEVSSLVGLFALAVVCFRCARTLDQELGSLEASN